MPSTVSSGASFGLPLLEELAPEDPELPPEELLLEEEVVVDPLEDPSESSEPLHAAAPSANSERLAERIRVHDTWRAMLGE